jgi:hypothetical protein
MKIVEFVCVDANDWTWSCNHCGELGQMLRSPANICDLFHDFDRHVRDSHQQPPPLPEEKESS